MKLSETVRERAHIPTMDCEEKARDAEIVQCLWAGVCACVCVCGPTRMPIPGGDICQACFSLYSQDLEQCLTSASSSKQFH